MSILWTSRNLLIFCFIRFFGYWFLSYKFFIFVSSYLKAIKTEHILELCLDQGFPKWAMTDIQGATSSKGARGGPWAVKEPQRGHRSWFEKFETHTRYSGVANEEQKKKVIGVTYGSLWVILLKGSMTFLISLKGAICKKFGKPWFR